MNKDETLQQLASNTNTNSNNNNNNVKHFDAKIANKGDKDTTAPASNDKNNNHTFTNGVSAEIMSLTNGKTANGGTGPANGIENVFKLSHEDLAKRAASPLQGRLFLVLFRVKREVYSHLVVFKMQNLKN